MQLSSLPNLDTVLKKIDLTTELVRQIYLRNQDETLIGMSIINAIEDNIPATSILNYVKEMAKDNRVLVDSIISCELTEQILAI